MRRMQSVRAGCYEAVTHTELDGLTESRTDAGPLEGPRLPIAPCVAEKRLVRGCFRFN